MRVSVAIIGVEGEQDILRAAERGAEVARMIGLDDARQAALSAEMAKAAQDLLYRGGGEIEVLVDNGPRRDILLCSGDSVTTLPGKDERTVTSGQDDIPQAPSSPVQGVLLPVGALVAESAEHADDAIERLTWAGAESLAAGIRDKFSLLDALTMIRDREDQLRKLMRAVEQSPAMIIMTDTGGRIEYVNPKFTEVTGYSLEEAIGNTPNLLRSGKMPAEVYEEMWRTILAGNEWRGELHNRKKSGELYWELALISPIRDECGAVTHFISVKEDITDRKRVEQELVAAREEATRASAAKSEFLANMSHEIRTPLNAIIGMADLLWETNLSAEQREYVRVFRRAGSTLMNLINDILDLSKVESGHLALETADFDLRALLEKTCEVMAVPAHEKDVELVYYVRPEVPSTLVGDPTRLRQVITNLIGNAIKFTEHGEVVVEVALDPSADSSDAEGAQNLHFTVRDTGIGISSDRLSAIFERFAQAGPETTRNYGGTGLGLTISKQLVDLMGGRMWVESEVGYGSTFHFTARFGRQPLAERATPLAESDLKDLKVLVVDDNSTNRFILREMLGTWGARVATASGGRLALLELRRAREHGDPYRLVLLDCRMPDMDGFQLAERITAELEMPETALVMLTSDRLNGDVSRMREIGIDQYLVKPVKRSDLLDAIAAALGKPRLSVAPVSEGGEQAEADDTRPLRVLLVEDSEDSQLLIQSYLKKTPYTLEFAENGQEGVDKFKAARYDVVLMDTQMPVMDGTTATRLIRTWESEAGLRPTPIIALTAYALREDAQRSLQSGCDAHLSKPVKKAKLLETIMEHTLGVPPGEESSVEGDSAGGRIVVQADADIADLIPRYLENRRKEVDYLRAALDREEFEAIRNVGHTLKGTGGGYGFAAISEIGKEMERAGSAGDADRIASLIDRLVDYLDRVDVVFNPVSLEG
ncbi:MAG TPA: response regulator [Chloroflexota bacterium]